MSPLSAGPRAATTAARLYLGLVSVMRHRADWGLEVSQSAHEAIRSPYDLV